MTGKIQVKSAELAQRYIITPVKPHPWIAFFDATQNKCHRIWILLPFSSSSADFSTPIIRVDIPPKACGPAMLTLTCSSYGGYSKSHRPEVFGLLNNETVEWKITSNVSDNETKLLTITSTLQLNVTQEDLFILCSVGYPGSKVSTNYSLSKFLPILCIPGVTHTQHSNTEGCRDKISDSYKKDFATLNHICL